MFSLILIVLSHSLPVEPKPTMEDVLGMMAKIPAVERPGVTTLGRFDKAADAKEIAEAIARVSPDRGTAAEMAVYAAWESNNVKCAVGDHGKSFGTWQLRYTTQDIACTPRLAAQVWLYRAKDAEKRCSANPPEERLAPLASGSCLLARQKVRHRHELALAIASD